MPSLTTSFRALDGLRLARTLVIPVQTTDDAVVWVAEQPVALQSPQSLKRSLQCLDARHAYDRATCRESRIMPLRQTRWQ